MAMGKRRRKLRRAGHPQGAPSASVRLRRYRTLKAFIKGECSCWRRGGCIFYGKCLVMQKQRCKWFELALRPIMPPNIKVGVLNEPGEAESED